MKRIGTTNMPSYRIVVADARFQRDGKTVEELGFYDPKHSKEKIDVARAEYWISKGAQPSETVSSVIKRVKAKAAAAAATTTAAASAPVSAPAEQKA